MKLHGFYLLKNEFFDLIRDPYLKSNKNGKRPFYYCLKDFDENELYWMIPLSSKIDKYKLIMKNRSDKHRPNDGIYICKLPSGVESVFLIQDMFPVTKKYVDREYTINGRHLIFPYDDDIKEINKRVNTIKILIKKDIKITPTSPDVKRIIDILKQQK